MHADDRRHKDCLPHEEPQHRVRITKPFYLGMYEVTQEEYQRVVGTNPSHFSATGVRKDVVGGQDTKRFPVEQVSCFDAMRFCQKLSDWPEEKAARRAYRLPSEAQWEYACRAGSTGRFSFSSGRSKIPNESEDRDLSDYGWFRGNSRGMTHAVGGKRANSGDCTICTGTCASSARIGTRKTIMRSAYGRSDWSPWGRGPRVSRR